MRHRRTVTHPCVERGCHTDPLARILHGQEIIMGVLEDLQAADEALAAEVTDLADEQATFLADVAARLANAPDPAAVAAVTADVTAKADALRALADAQRAADPGAPPA